VPVVPGSDASASQRQLAERALDARAADAGGDEMPEWPAAAGRLRAARTGAGLSNSALASRLGMTVESYDDLERRDDDIFTVPSLRDIVLLAHLVGIVPRVLLLGAEAAASHDPLSFADLTSLLAQRMDASGETMEELIHEIGWDVRELIHDPQELWSYSVEGLYEVCKAVRADWVAALPESP
jgi:transcriptional regulator with XRE-family HTH domain